MAETQVQKYMRLLGVTEEEALQIIADDKRVDKGENQKPSLTRWYSLAP